MASLQRVGARATPWAWEGQLDKLPPSRRLQEWPDLARALWVNYGRGDGADGLTEVDEIASGGQVKDGWSRCSWIRLSLRLGIPLEERVILAVGRIEPRKGLDILIRSLADLSDRAGVVLYGGGGDDRAEAEVARLRLVAEQTGVSDAVRFLGPRPHEVLPDYYAAADVVAVPSFYESFGLVAVEAMASGVPVVASRVGGLASTVADGRTGYLIPWRCPTPFAEKIEVLLRNEELRRALGAGARRRMEQGYAWSAVARSVAALYEELVAEGARPVVASAAS